METADGEQPVVEYHRRQPAKLNRSARGKAGRSLTKLPTRACYCVWLINWPHSHKQRRARIVCGKSDKQCKSGILFIYPLD